MGITHMPLIMHGSIGETMMLVAVYEVTRINHSL
jgi:hypothetical protein